MHSIIRPYKYKSKKELCEYRVYEVKVDKSSLSKEKLEYLNRLFLEAKWWYNYILMQDDAFTKICKTTKIQVMNKDRQLENRELKYLCFRMRRKLQEKIMISLKSLSTLKRKHQKTGKLKFKSVINTIPGEFHIGNNKIRMTGFKKWFRVRGLNQIPKNANIKTIELIRKCNDYYFFITISHKKEQQIKTNQYIGCDFGIRSTMSFSNGIKVDVNLPITGKIKKLQKIVNKKQKNSNNWNKSQIKLQNAYNDRNKQKLNAQNKIIHFLKANYDHICIQDDNILKWRKQYRKKVSNSIIGRTVGKLKELPKTIVVDQYFPSTKLCPICHTLTTLSLSDRVFKCQNCSYEEDRDVKAAKMILVEGMKQVEVPMEYGDLKLVENETSVAMHEYMKSIPHIKVSLVR